MNARAAELVGISIYRMLVMQLTSCMTLEVAVSNAWFNSRQPPFHVKKNVVRLKAHGSKTRVQGHKAQGLGHRVQGASLLLLGSRL